MADNTMNREQECRTELSWGGGGGSGVERAICGGMEERGAGRAKRSGATFRNDGATFENNENRYGVTDEK
ncbi:unnamed protein product [Macrosiphum euphorbiae]|uniref:Uncharacterized protein n=1 Tax=Macrosiphum euphorbiae TaxID=13131 RepID=A0AAV0W267_9HEMI|nr:unnamed protein product [Macrosiphum euphorbiae]